MKKIIIEIINFKFSLKFVFLSRPYNRMYIQLQAYIIMKYPYKKKTHF